MNRPAMGRTGVAALTAIMVLAFGLRLRGIAFGLPALNDPDELIFELGALRMLRTGTLDPGWYGHPATLTMYLLALVDAGVLAAGRLSGRFADAADFAGQVWLDPGIIVLPGRAAMALVGGWSVWLCWQLGRALGGIGAGLVAALLLAICPVHVTWSQVIRSDVMAAAFLQLVLLASLRVAQGGGRRDLVRTTFWLACAAATKWPAALAATAIAGAVIASGLSRRETWGGIVRRLAGAGGMSLCCFALVAPVLVLAPARVLRDLGGEVQVRHLEATGHGFFGNLLWYAQGPLLAGFGAVGLLLAFAGLAALAGSQAGSLGDAERLARGRRALAVLVPCMLAQGLALGFQGLVWERWAIPLLPVLAALAGLGTMAVLWGFRDAPSFSPMRPTNNPTAVCATVVILIAACLAPMLAMTERARERADDTRQRATAWAIAHIPPGRTILVEHFAFDMLRQPWAERFPMGEAGCIDVRARLSARMDYRAIAAARGGRSNLDYGTMPADLRATCRADYAILTQYDRYARECARFAQACRAYRALLAQGQVVATIRPEPGEIGGPVVRIVRLSVPGSAEPVVGANYAISSR
ncbi:glycosyltransferase family 39 protein [Sphingomonas sp. IC081]|uniref:glycosyltransferase family 39 protein n=1 Tax=Sphingomonas sp. IC081 TaxID=304378 RepID=UPI00163C035B|nr:glycosyltransferase family 39 protein [Sphingomonas sp. IC081]